MSEDRKKDHIQLALESRVVGEGKDVYYEPLLSAHPDDSFVIGCEFLGHELKAPFWVSSMTGGTEKAFKINHNLAQLCCEFGLGMGLGSCRPLLDGRERLKDFDLKSVYGDFPLYMNLGIAQLEQLVKAKQLSKVEDIQKTLQTDGLIIHVNPLQEWLQPEGDRYKRPAIETIKNVVDQLSTKIIVKEVGQGFGPKSLESLINLDIAAIEFAGLGGTNFSQLELTRQDAKISCKNNSSRELVKVGHTAKEMIEWVNQLQANNKTKSFIISGGITNAIDGYILQEMLQAPSIIGMAGELLKYAQDYSLLKDFISSEIESYKLAKCFLKGK